MNNKYPVPLMTDAEVAEENDHARCEEADLQWRCDVQEDRDKQQGEILEKYDKDVQALVNIYSKGLITQFEYVQKRAIIQSETTQALGDNILSAYMTLTEL